MRDDARIFLFHAGPSGTLNSLPCKLRRVRAVPSRISPNTACDIGTSIANIVLSNWRPHLMVKRPAGRIMHDMKHGF